MIGYCMLESEAMALAALAERLKPYGIFELPGSTPDYVKLCDPDGNVLNAFPNELGKVAGFSRYMGDGMAGYIIDAISHEFGVKIYHEMDPQDEIAEGELPND